MYLAKIIIVSFLLCWGYGQLNSAEVLYKNEIGATDKLPIAKTSQQRDPFFNRVYFSASDAEKILGEKAILFDSSSIAKKDTLECKAAYKSISKDGKRGKSGAIYFMIEQYTHDLSAKKAFTSIKRANENAEGVKTVYNLADEAYFHSDGQNFYFILVRKGKKMFRIKVNAITSHTSLEEFNRVSKKLADNL
jgi:hypothetical protein